MSYYQEVIARKEQRKQNQSIANDLFIQCYNGDEEPEFVFYDEHESLEQPLEQIRYNDPCPSEDEPILTTI